MKIVSNHFKYASNVWLTSAILTPCLFGFITSLFDGGTIYIPLAIVFIIPFGILFSIPNYLILFYFVRKINKTKITIVEKKVIINIIAVPLTFLLFIIIFFNDFDEESFFINLPLSYSATLTSGIWFFNLYRPSSEDVLQKEPLPKIKMLDDILDNEIY